MILVMTIGYGRPEYVRAGVEYFLQNSDRSEYDRYVLVDPGYPLTPRQQLSDLRWLAHERGIDYLPIANLGCHKNWDHVARHYNLGEGDILVGVCPDARGTRGWVSAGVRVLRAEPACFTVQLNRHIDYQPYGVYAAEAAGIPLLRFPNLVAWSVGMFNMGLVQSVGGFDAYNKFYGFGEHFLVDKLVPQGKWWCFLRDYYDAGGVLSPDPEYRRWKELSAAKLVQVSFELWLQLGMPEQVS